MLRHQSRARKVLAYVMSLVVTASALWYPAPVFAQATIIGTSSDPTTAGVEATYPHDDESFLVCDDGDATKCTEFELSGLTTGNNPIWALTGTTAAPTLQGGTSNWFLNVAGTSRVVIATTGLGVGTGVLWGGAAIGSTDVGWTRHAAGVWATRDDTASSVRGLMGGGASVASAAALPAPTGGVFHVTGTTNVTSITSTNFEAGVCVTLIFDDVLTFTDGNNLTLAGNFATTANDTISLCYDGTNWYETARSVN